MAKKLNYPRNGSKVSSSSITFRWETGDDARQFLLQIFEMVPGRNPRDPPSLRRVLSSVTFGTSYLARLQPGKAYLWEVRPWASSSPPPDPIGGQDPRADPAAVVGTFFVKPQENYLEHYFTLLKKRHEDDLLKGPLSPIVPLFFQLLDRHLNVPGTATTYDSVFTSALSKLPAELRSPERLQRSLKNYQLTREADRKELFGTPPSDRNDVAWVESAIGKCFEGREVLDALRHEASKDKRVTLEFKPAGAGRIKEGQVVVKLTTQEAADAGILERNQYFLHVTAGKSTISLPLIAWKVEVPRGGVWIELRGDGTALLGLDSALFAAGVTRRETRDQFLTGSVTVQGGRPVLVGLQPQSLKLSGNSEVDKLRSVDVVVRNAGVADPGFLIGPTTQQPVPATKSAQSFEAQTFRISVGKLDDRQRQVGSHTLKWHPVSAGPDESVNELSLNIALTEYRLLMKTVKCVDVSDPELWSDSISVQALSATKHFLAINAETRQFEEGFVTGRTQNVPNPCVYGPAGTARMIEEWLDVEVAVFEHDDLSWISWLINKVIDLVQSFVIGLAATYTLGGGGYMIELALEASGINDLREQAVDAVVASFEIEVLHEGNITLTSSDAGVERLLHMITDESHYDIKFMVQRA